MRDALHETEAVLLNVLEAPLNKRGPKWKDTKEFVQVFDEDALLDSEEMLRSILSRVKRIEGMVG